MKIIATQTFSDSGNDSLIKFELLKSGRLHYFTYHSEGRTIDFWFSDVPAMQIREDVNTFERFNEYIETVNCVSFITSAIKAKVIKSGFVWSEMRRRCEIDMEFVHMEWKLTYRKTGMPKKETITIPDGTLHSLFKSINSILFD